jgi:hypothetical protein
MAYSVFMDGWDRGPVGRMWQVHTEGLTVNAAGGRHDSACLEREYGPATDDWIRSTLFTPAPCVTLGFAIYLPSGLNNMEFRLARNWERQIALTIGDYGLYGLIDGGGDEIWSCLTALPLDSWHYIEFGVLCDPLGSYELRVNGSTVIYETDVDTQWLSGQVMNSVYIGWGGTTSSGAKIDDLYIAYGDELKFFGDSRVDTLPLIANKEPQDWFPNPAATPAEDVYQLLNQDEGTINAITADDVSMFLPEALSSGAYWIWGVQIVARAGKTDPGDASIALELRYADDLVDGAAIPLSTSKLTYWQGYAINPVTETPWTPAQVVNIDIGVKSIA